MAANIPVDVQQVLMVCGAGPAEINVLVIREQLDTLQEFGMLTKENVESMATRLERRSVQNGRLIMSTKLMKNIQALCYWAQQKLLRREVLNANEFDVMALMSAREAMNTKEDQQDAPDIKPEMFKPDKWYEFNKFFPMYLSHHSGRQHATLDYVIRDDVPAGHVHGTPREQQLYSYPHAGNAYKEDNKTVYRILANLVQGTDGFTWIESFHGGQDGRAAWISLKNHYEGGGNKEKVITRAESILTNIHYKNEQTFSFELFSGKFLGALRDLRNYGREKTKYEEVRLLLEKVQLNQTRVEVAKAHVREHFKDNVEGAITYLSTEFAEMFPVTTFGSSGNRRHIHESSTRGPRNDGNRDGRQERRPTQNQDGNMMLNGVDVTNVGREFRRDEMTRLGRAGQSYVFSERNRLGLNRNQNYNRDGLRDNSQQHQQNERNIQEAGVAQQQEPPHQLPPPPALNPPAPPGNAGCNGAPPGNAGGNRGPNNGNRFGAGRYGAPGH